MNVGFFKGKLPASVNIPELLAVKILGGAVALLKRGRKRASGCEALLILFVDVRKKSE